MESTDQLAKIAVLRRSIRFHPIARLDHSGARHRSVVYCAEGIQSILIRVIYAHVPTGAACAIVEISDELEPKEMNNLPPLTVREGRPEVLIDVPEVGGLGAIYFGAAMYPRIPHAI